jgi:adenosylmethionine-8-amino-7-oxononanoate aminotransferase
MAAYWETALHSLKGLPHVADIRNLGLIGAIELETIPGKPGARAMAVYKSLCGRRADPYDRRHHCLIATADSGQIAY